ncbi:MAG: hypothetical protein ACXAC7_22565 [Candidatus Hodarchaeales archaeon]|jgi:hypothetical protein
MRKIMKKLTVSLKIFLFMYVISFLTIPGSAAHLVTSQEGSSFSVGTITEVGDTDISVSNSGTDKEININIGEDGYSYGYVTLTSNSFYLDGDTIYRFNFYYVFDGHLQESGGSVLLQFTYRVRGVVVETFNYATDQNWYTQSVTHSFTKSFDYGWATASVRVYGSVYEGSGSNYLDFWSADELMFDKMTVYCLYSCE